MFMILFRSYVPSSQGKYTIQVDKQLGSFKQKGNVVSCYYKQLCWERTVVKSQWRLLEGTMAASSNSGLRMIYKAWKCLTTVTQQVSS